VGNHIGPFFFTSFGQFFTEAGFSFCRHGGEVFVGFIGVEDGFGGIVESRDGIPIVVFEMVEWWLCGGGGGCVGSTGEGGEEFITE